MKNIIYSVLTLIFLSLPVTRLHASSETAYKDYLSQFDTYRQQYNDFQIARNEYQKFKSLTSETVAIQKTKEMMITRTQLLRSYLLLLNEKINETPTLTDQERNFYTDSIKTENSFLENHSLFINSMETIDDLIKASKQLEDRYIVLQTTMRQTVLGLNLARLRVLSVEYTDRMVDIKNLIDEARKELTTEQLGILDRWFVQIGNKKTLYTQKQEQITQTITSLKSSKIEELDKKFQETNKKLTDALLELKEGTSYMTELSNAMKYRD